MKELKAIHYKNKDSKLITYKVETHGRWERTPDGAARCTACGRKMNPSQYGYPYCSLCGARMDGK